CAVSGAWIRRPASRTVCPASGASTGGGAPDPEYDASCAVSFQGGAPSYSTARSVIVCRAHTSAPEDRAASRTRSQRWPRVAARSSWGEGAQAVAYRNWKGRQPRRTASAGAPRARQKAAHAPGSSVSSSKTTPSAEVNGGPPGAVSAASASSAPAAARYCETASSPARSTLTSVLVTREPRAWARSPASRP